MTISFSLPRALRIVFGVLLISIGYNFFGNIFPQETMTLQSKYILGFIGVYELTDVVYASLQIVLGICLLANLWVPLILILVYPWVLNLTTYHLESNTNLFPVLTILVSYVLLLLVNRKTFSSLLRGNIE